MESVLGQNPIKSELDVLRDRGYVVVPRFLDGADLYALRKGARSQLAAGTGSLELEADLRYPGAPHSRADVGGGTIRRLLDAYGRDPLFARCATAPRVRSWLEAYFGEDIVMSRAHHNCLMTKHPRYGSQTNWHRDVRYWRFEREDLVSLWFALGDENENNGALRFVPGSHRKALEEDQFDKSKFLRLDRADNIDLIRTAVSPRLRPGDAIFFHCGTLHSAGQNHSDEVKYSLVYTYHGRSNAPIGGTRSASVPEVLLE
jgi:phytanoyl-CoA hydroxylase